MGVIEIFEDAGIKPRTGQLEAAQTIAEKLIEGRSLAFIAPTGFGKTLTVLAALKASGRLPVVWRVRSLALGFRVSEDASLLGLRSFTAAGREKTCPLAEEKGSDVHEYCRSYRLSCRYFLETDFSGTVAATSWAELLGVKGCPYYLQDRAMEQADVIIQSYYRRAPRFYRAVVWDEAHNLLVPRETCITVSMLREASLELKTIGEDGLARMLSRIEPREDGSYSVEEEILISLYSAYRKLLSQGYGRTATGRVYRVLGSEAVYWESGRLCGAKLKPFVPGPDTVFLSATLPHPELLGVEEVIEVSLTMKRRLLITSWLTTKYDDFDRHVGQYRELLSALKFRFSKVLAFATRRVASKLKDNATLYEAELTKPPPDWRGILLLHSRGRFAEGVDINADVVVILGAPFLPPHALKRIERVLRRAGLEGDYASASMLSTTLQCIGRATRSPSDNPVILLADRRYEKYLPYLSSYYNIDIINDLNEMLEVLKQVNVEKDATAPSPRRQRHFRRLENV